MQNFSAAEAGDVRLSATSGFALVTSLVDLLITRAGIRRAITGSSCTDRKGLAAHEE